MSNRGIKDYIISVVEKIDNKQIIKNRYDVTNKLCVPKFDINICSMNTEFKNVSNDGKPSFSTIQVYKRLPYFNIAFEAIDAILYSSIKARKLFHYIVTHIKDTNKIVLSTEDIMKIIDTVHKPVAYNTVKELIDANIIAKTDEKENGKHIYCINHNYIFCGNYIDFINKCRIIYLNDADRKDEESIYF